MSDIRFVDTLLFGRLQSASRSLFWAGLGMLVLGVGAIVFPLASTLAVALLIGSLLLISGILTLIGSFSIHGTGLFFGALLLGLISIGAGVFMLGNPLAGAVSLTILVGFIFMFEGAFELVLAFKMRPHAGWGLMLLSGIASILIAILIASGWPAISAIALGIMLGVNFITTGVGYIAVSRALKPVT